MANGLHVQAAPHWQVPSPLLFRNMLERAEIRPVYGTLLGVHPRTSTFFFFFLDTPF
jgi:hypothetical protein